MFRCHVNNHLSERGEKRTLVTVETRPAYYADGKRVESIHEAQTVGYETVKEVPFCPKHLDGRDQ